MYIYRQFDITIYEKSETNSFNQLYLDYKNRFVHFAETLPKQTRDIFIRSRYNNQSHKEIAAALGISTKTVEFHITKALKVLRIALKGYYPLLAFFPRFFC